MKRYFISSLGAGLVHAVLAFVFVHFLLDGSLRQELEGVLARVEGRAADAGAGSEFVQVAMHLAIRLAFGLVTVGLFAWLVRKRPRLRAARMAGAVFWIVGYLVVPSVMAVKYGMSATLLFVCYGYGLLETQLAAHTGALLWREPRAKA